MSTTGKEYGSRINNRDLIRRDLVSVYFAVVPR